ncbi:CbtB domain-containing protein [Nocardioides aquiterrae]|uniref:CbtB-domain containing protein n=1 Tax=Nocardioides aquiterrae TaxID=203799 RepID=A0ABP4ETR8_9ACTN
MSNTVTTTTDRVPAWAYVMALLALGLLYLLLQDNGAVLSNVAPYVHEFTHDGRHVLAVPCH